MNQKVQTLKAYIAEHHGNNQAAFARHVGVARCLVSQWVRCKYMMFGDDMYSLRRKVKPVENDKVK